MKKILKMLLPCLNTALAVGITGSASTAVPQWNKSQYRSRSRDNRLKKMKKKIFYAASQYRSRSRDNRLILTMILMVTIRSQYRSRSRDNRQFTKNYNYGKKGLNTALAVGITGKLKISQLE